MKKIEGLFMLGEPLTITEIISYTNLSEKEVRKVVDKLIKKGKIKWDKYM